MSRKYLVILGAYVTRESEVYGDSPLEAVLEANEQGQTEVVTLKAEYLEDDETGEWWEVVGECSRCTTTILERDEDGAKDQRKHAVIDGELVCEDCASSQEEGK
jgi:hypothetical protein